MPVEKADTQSGWRKDGDDDDGGASTCSKAEKKHKRKHHKGKAAAPLLPHQSFKSARTAVVVAG